MTHYVTLKLARCGRIMLALGAWGVLLAAGPVWAAEPAAKAAPVKPAEAKPASSVPAADQKTSATYPLDTCIVSGDKLGGSMGQPVKYDYQGREVQFCCKGCVKDFNKDRRKYLGKLDEVIIKRQKPAYPLDTCVVSGAKLGGAMGQPVDYVAKDNRLVRFCCKMCIAKYEAAPAKYEAKLDAAAKAKAAAIKPAPAAPAGKS